MQSDHLTVEKHARIGRNRANNRSMAHRPISHGSKNDRTTDFKIESRMEARCAFSRTIQNPRDAIGAQRVYLRFARMAFRLRMISRCVNARLDASTDELVVRSMKSGARHNAQDF